MRHSGWILIPAAIIVPFSNGYATQYLSLEQAQKVLFPDANRFEDVKVQLTKDQMKAIQKSSRMAVRNGTQNVWKAVRQDKPMGYVWVDQVIGKHEFITYAVGLNVDGSVKQVEVMDYRETYGYQVREAGWRKQFIGKTAADHLKLEEDIQNISGATLSCRNITDGVRRILNTYALLFK